MAEELATAESAREVVPGIWHWSVHDPRIDFVSSSLAVSSDDGVVLIDPMPLGDNALGRLGRVTAIVCTAGSHQRAIWRYRSELGAPVYGPALSKTLAEEPDVRYGDGDALPGGLRAVFTPGAGTTAHTLLLDRDDGVAFVGDLLLRTRSGNLRFVSDRYLHDPAQARQSVRRLLELPFSILFLAHGEEPVTEHPKGAIRAALERDESS